MTFPDMGKLAEAYGYPYCRCEANDQLDACLNEVFASEGAYICEVMVSPEQFFEPNSATKKMPDGSLFSPPLEDLAPFLPREELLANLYIDPILE